MKSGTEHLLSVSRVTMGPSTPAPDARIEIEPAGPPPGMAEVELALDVVGVPAGAFSWS